jgi:hypothetical protein
MIGLRHRQRAALTLHHVLGFEVEDVGRALGIRAADAQAVVVAATSALTRKLGEPMDVALALSAYGCRMIDRVVRLPEPQHLEVAKLPRPVTRRLVGPPVPRLEPQPPVAGPVQRMLARAESQAPDLRSMARPVAATPVTLRQPTHDRRWILAVAAVLALITMFVSASSQRRVEVLASGPVVAPAAAPAAQPPHAAVVPRVTVRLGDSLWRIAAVRLGDGMRWREIWRLNRGRTFAGERFTNPSLIRPRWRLILPSGG